MPTALCLVCVSLFMLLGSCAAPVPKSKVPEMRELARSQLESDWRQYVDFAFAHNERLRNFKRLKTEADFDLDATTEEGPLHETGHAILWIDWPSRAMLNLKHNLTGDTHVWCGHDSKRAWLFEDTQEESTCSIALIENAYSDCCRGFPLFFPPHELHCLVGMAKLPTDPARFSFQREAQEWIVTEKTDPVERRIFLQAETGEHLRTELVVRGRIVVSSTLTGHKPMSEAAGSDGFLLPMRIEMWVSAYNMRLSIRVYYADEQKDLFHNSVFEPSAIALTMGTKKWVVLDENCPNSARAPASSPATQSSQ